MATLVLRGVKGSPLTNQEIDANFTNLNDELATVTNSTRNSNPWVASTAVVVGNILNVTGTNRYYTVTTAGTTGTVPPTHTTGSALNGTAQLTWHIPSAYTANDVLAKILTVDGTGSGLDADTLDGLNSSTTNTPNTIMARDGSGNTTVNTLTATTVSTATFTVSGNSNLGDSISDVTNITSQLRLNGSGGTSGQVLTSTGTGIPQWTTINPRIIVANDTNPGLNITQDGTGDAIRINDVSSDTTPFVVNNSGLVGVQIATPVVTLDVGGVDGISVPSGTTAQRPTVTRPTIRYNQTLGSFEGYNGTFWGAIGGGATGGGTNRAFYLNDTTITSNYTIPVGQNAGTFGPVTIADGITVTVSDGSNWTIT